MDCPQCGDHCYCTRTAPGDAVPATVAVSEAPYAPRQIAVGQSFTPAETLTQADPDWRKEIASRLQAHRAKRRKRNGEDDTMSLGFDEPPQYMVSVAFENDDVPQRNHWDSWDPPEPAPQRVPFEPDFPSEAPAAAASSDEVTEEMFAGFSAPAVDDPQPRIVERRIQRGGDRPRRKLIEFPRQWTAESLAFELAEPVLESPRILEAEVEAPPAETTPAMPQVATVHLDDHPDQQEWMSSYNAQPGDSHFEVPLPVAPLAARSLSAMVDAAVVLGASMLFVVVVLLSAKHLPQGKLALASFVLVPGALWALYQYVFLVFSGSTPGMQMAQLQLCDFDGAFPLRGARQSRAAALVLSCMSLGLGFAWVMVDEDCLGWHDRMTKTYLRSN